MIKTLPYKNLNDTLRHFKAQVIDGIPYAKKNLPQFTDPQQIFDYLKLRTKYKHDPKDTELFQTLPTLLENNYHGQSGLGDCDCFSIALCSVLAANNFKNFGIVLVGRNRLTPVHIYCYVIDANNEKKFLDLTNKYYDQTRSYPYRQEIQFNLTPKEKENMVLELAEMAGRSNRLTPEQKKQSLDRRRKRNAYLRKMQKEHKRKVMQGQKMRPNYNHIYLPSRNMQIREDAFDNLHENDFQTMLLSEGYQLEEIVELSGRRGDRRRARKDEKQALKKEKKLSKVELRRARAEKKRASGEAKKTRAQAKQDKANRGRGGGDGEESEAESTAGRIFGKVIGGAKQAIGVYKSARGGGGGEDEESSGGGDQESGGGSSPSRTKTDTPGQPKTINVFGKEIKQSTAILAGLGIAAAAAITIIAVKKSKTSRSAA